MERILISGGNGVLGSSLSKLFLKLGNDVSVTDIIRRDECWRLLDLGIMDEVEYNWIASQDISPEYLKGFDLIIDCAIGFPDRPFGTGSPRAAINANLDPAVGMLEALRKLSDPPPVIYPSSFNSLYGNHGVYDESTFVNPTSIYGWTKAAAEQLYQTYHHSFGIPILITRVGSSYGEMMRTDEVVAKVIMANLQNKAFALRSPYSKRLWTYLGDVMSAYEAIVKRSDYGQNALFKDEIDSRNSVINVAGNVNDEITNNVELCRLISNITGAETEVRIEDYYEPGENIRGQPVNFDINADWSRTLLKWSPHYSLREGLEKTIIWFSGNYMKVTAWKTH